MKTEALRMFESTVKQDGDDIFIKPYAISLELTRRINRTELKMIQFWLNLRGKSL